MNSFAHSIFIFFLPTMQVNSDSDPQFPRFLRFRRFVGGCAAIGFGCVFIIAGSIAVCIACSCKAVSDSQSYPPVRRFFFHLFNFIDCGMQILGRNISPDKMQQARLNGTWLSFSRLLPKRSRWNLQRLVCQSSFHHKIKADSLFMRQNETKNIVEKKVDF